MRNFWRTFAKNNRKIKWPVVTLKPRLKPRIKTPLRTWPDPRQILPGCSHTQSARRHTWRCRDLRGNRGSRMMIGGRAASCNHRPPSMARVVARCCIHACMRGLRQSLQPVSGRTPRCWVTGGWPSGALTQHPTDVCKTHTTY